MTPREQPSPMDAPAPGAVTPVLRSLRVLVGGVAGGIAVMALALAFILTFSPPPTVAVAGLLALGIAVHLVARVVGYRASPVPRRAAPEVASAQAMRVFRSLLMLRMAMSESVVLVAMVLAFVTPARSWFLVALGAALSLLLLALHVWPSRSTGERVVASLESDGAVTGLGAVLGWDGR